jgi:hypothetical protein
MAAVAAPEAALSVALLHQRGRTTSSGRATTSETSPNGASATAAGSHRRDLNSGRAEGRSVFTNPHRIYRGRDLTLPTGDDSDATNSPAPSSPTPSPNRPRQSASELLPTPAEATAPMARCLSPTARPPGPGRSAPIGAAPPLGVSPKREPAAEPASSVAPDTHRAR